MNSKNKESKEEEVLESWKSFGKSFGVVVAAFIREQLRRPSPSAPVRIRADGVWKDTAGVVHAVNATWIEPDVDLGRETACASTAWDPDNPRDYPVMIDEAVDCMTCVVKQVRSCL